MKEVLSSAHQKRFMACLRTPGPWPPFINKNGGKYEVGSLSITPRDVSRALRSIAEVSAL